MNRPGADPAPETTCPSYKAPCPAPDLFTGLLSRGIIIRALKSYGLPELLRVSIGNDEENAAFLAAFKDIIDHAV